MYDPSQDTQPPGPFVDAAWLERNLDDRNLRVIDTRGRVPASGERPVSLRDAFEQAHIPGAQFVDWFDDFVDIDDDVPNQLAGPVRFEAAASRLGIDEETLVVAYDDYHSIFAGRIWWAFRAMGHDRVRVLDGGLTSWRAEGRALEQTERRLPARRFVARPRPQLRWTIEQVAERSAATVLVDARSRERFEGRAGDLVPGHVPGAVNAPYAELVGADGLLRPVEELRAVLLRAGIDPDAPPASIVASCGSGISASVPLLALEVLAPGAGAHAAVYDGSWAEWSRSGRPIETGTGNVRTP